MWYNILSALEVSQPQSRISLVAIIQVAIGEGMGGFNRK